MKTTVGILLPMSCEKSTKLSSHVARPLQESDRRSRVETSTPQDRSKLENIRKISMLSFIIGRAASTYDPRKASTISISPCSHDNCTASSWRKTFLKVAPHPDWHWKTLEAVTAIPWKEKSTSSKFKVMASELLSYQY